MLKLKTNDKKKNKLIENLFITAGDLYLCAHSFLVAFELERAHDVKGATDEDCWPFRETPTLPKI